MLRRNDCKKRGIMEKRQILALLMAAPLILFGCSHKEQTSTSSSSNESTTESASASAETTPSPEAAASAVAVTTGPTFAAFNFNDVAVTSSAAPLLRLGFDLKNNGTDPLLCDPTEFAVQLSDNSTISADTGAEDTCDPDTIDPGSTGKVVMYFDLKSAYSGPVTLIMTANNAVVGKGTTQVR